MFMYKLKSGAPGFVPGHARFQDYRAYTLL